MGRKNSPSAKKQLATLITNYEEAKAENRQLYLDADQLADIADWYASERKFEEAQEVITYGLKIHPGNTALLIEQAYLYLDTQKLQKAKKVADSITEDFDSEVKLLKAELLLNGGKLEEAQWLLSTIADADELETIIDVVFLYLDMGYPDAAKEWLDRGKSRYAEDEEYMDSRLSGIDPPSRIGYHLLQQTHRQIPFQPFLLDGTGEMLLCSGTNRQGHRSL